MDLLSKNWVGYDSECLRDVKPPYSFKAAEHLGNGVCCTLDSRGDNRDFVGDLSVPALWMFLSQFEVLVTYNGPGFDNPLLGGSMLGPEHPQARDFFNNCFKGRHVDLCKDFAKALGARFVKLEDIAIPTLGDHKEMDGGFAPEQLRKGKYLEVITYCRGDNRRTIDLFIKACKGETLKYIKGAKANPNGVVKEFTCEPVLR